MNLSKNSLLRLENISKDYGSLEVIKDISLEVKKGEFVSILGPSGSGKTSLFRIIAGLDQADRGQIHLANKGIGYMPQDDSLLPWKNLEDNIALPLLLKGKKKEEIRESYEKLLPIFGLEGFEKYYPFQLSGGMKQRAALLRTFLTGADLLLLDEPFASLDAITRISLQEWLLTVWEKFETSILFVTHSIEEAIYLSDRIYVLSRQPGTITMEKSLDLKRPRSPEMMTSKEFNDYRDIFYKALRGD